MASDKSITTTVKPKKEPVRPQQPAARTGGPGPFDRPRKYLGEVTTELKKTTWPTKQELISQVQVVLGLLVVVGVFIAGWDSFLGLVFKGLMAALGVRQH